MRALLGTASHFCQVVVLKLLHAETGYDNEHGDSSSSFGMVSDPPEDDCRLRFET